MRAFYHHGAFAAGTVIFVMDNILNHTLVGPILVVTPSVGFGELIRQALEESGAKQVRLATSGAEALDIVEIQPFQLCILDVDLADIPAMPLWSQIRDWQAGLPLILILPEGLAEGDLQQELNPDGYLTKPFYMPNLLSTVKQVLAPGLPAKETGPEGALTEEAAAQALPPWLDDVDRAAQYLTRLSLESAAQAALITRLDSLWAYAGEFPQPAVSELANAVIDHWANDGGTDLARFIRLDATGGEYMLYATGLEGDLVLALIFDTKTPFSEIRAQASQLAKALATNPRDQLASVNANHEKESGSETEPETDLDPSPEKPLPDMPPTFREPPPAADATDIKPEEQQPVEPFPAPPVGPTTPWTGLEFEEEMEDQKTETAAPAVPDEEALFIDPVSPALHHLSYVCVLIPRMPDHALSGDLVDQLRVWLPQICLASGWRFGGLSIEETLIQWIVSMPPNEPPSGMVDHIRLETSRRIIELHPRVRDQNITSDFWAPGYLIVGSSRFLTKRTVNNFVRRIRSWQGLRGRDLHAADTLPD